MLRAFRRSETEEVSWEQDGSCPYILYSCYKSVAGALGFPLRPPKSRFVSATRIFPLVEADAQNWARRQHHAIATRMLRQGHSTLRPYHIITTAYSERLRYAILSELHLHFPRQSAIKSSILKNLPTSCTLIHVNVKYSFIAYHSKVFEGSLLLSILRIIVVKSVCSEVALVGGL